MEPGENLRTTGVSYWKNSAHAASAPACAIPNATALAASFDPDLLHQAGSFLALETKARNAVCLLAPTVNIQRSPLGGRSFESFSEDPTLSGHLAAAFINGLQSGGVSATIKHFVGNDQEHERMGQDSIVQARPLREIYLRPFQIAQRLARPNAYMTGYNKLNGVHCSENSWLLQNILCKEWGHKGLIMSDWYGTYSSAEAVNSGLHLEMPGPASWRTSGLLARSMLAHKIDQRQIDKLVSGLLMWVQRLTRDNEELVYQTPRPETSRINDIKADSDFIRKLGTSAIVLLKNHNDILPLKKRRIAVIGPNAKARVITGGGSAQLAASWSSSPWEGLLVAKSDDTELTYSLGVFTDRYLPLLDDTFTDENNTPGMTVRHYAAVDGGIAKEPFSIERRDVSELMMADFRPLDGKDFCSEITAQFVAPINGMFQFSVITTGQAWCWVDGNLVVDNSADQTPGSAFFGCGTAEKRGSVTVTKGQVSHFEIEITDSICRYAKFECYMIVGYTQKPSGPHLPSRSMQSDWAPIR